MPSSKIGIKKPHLEESRAMALESHDIIGENHNFSSIQARSISEIEEVDLDA